MIEINDCLMLLIILAILIGDISGVKYLVHVVSFQEIAAVQKFKNQFFTLKIEYDVMYSFVHLVLMC